MFELHELRRARQRQPFPIPESACRIWDTFGLAPADTRVNVSFSLKARRRGTEIFFSVPTGTGAFSWNYSAINDFWPKDFTAARAWVKAYAAGFGQEVTEIVKPRAKLATGDDRKLMKAGGCKEAWLKSDIPELWATAMVTCQHPAGFCGEDGYCRYGDCKMQMD